MVFFCLLTTVHAFWKETVENKEFVFILTTSYNAIEKAAGALQLAVNMAAFDAKIDFFLMNEGAFLAKKGFAGSVSYQKAFSPVADLIKSLVEEFNCKFYICASCVKPLWIRGCRIHTERGDKTGFLFRRAVNEKTGIDVLIDATGYILTGWRGGNTGHEKDVDEVFRIGDQEFIELHDLLKVKGLCSTGGAAKAVITEGRVKVDGIVEMRKRRKIRKGQIVEYEGRKVSVL